MLEATHEAALVCRQAIGVVQHIYLQDRDAPRTRTGADIWRANGVLVRHSVSLAVSRKCNESSSTSRRTWHDYYRGGGFSSN